MDELIHIIENSVLYLIHGQSSRFDECKNSIISGFLELLPRIILVYTRPEMKDKASDALIWPQLFEKVYNNLQKADTFVLIDSLYWEVRNNLIYLNDTLKERNIDI